MLMMIIKAFIILCIYIFIYDNYVMITKYLNKFNPKINTNIYNRH